MSEEQKTPEQIKYETLYADDYDRYYDEEDKFPSDDYSDNPCDNCGPHCSEWLGDGLCNLVIKEQVRQLADYRRRHTGERNCPVCKKRLKRYDCVNVDTIWTWSADPYDPIIAVDVLGPIWLNKGVIHQKDNYYHVWIEWGYGIEERLIRLIPKRMRKIAEGRILSRECEYLTCKHYHEVGDDSFCDVEKCNPEFNEKNKV